MTYRRAIELRADDARTVTAELEDDFHQFAVRLHHDGTRVVTVQGAAGRFPWSTCPEAVAPLTALEGAPLGERVTDAGRHAEPRANCTHLFDLASLAMTHAAHGRDRRRYDAVVDVAIEGAATARLTRDGDELLEWQLRDAVLVGPAPYTEGPWRGGFLRWAEARFPPDEAEAVIVLRRACDIGRGTWIDLDTIETAGDLMSFMGGICFTFTPGTAERGRRRIGTTRTFTGNDELLRVPLLADPEQRAPG